MGNGSSSRRKTTGGQRTGAGTGGKSAKLAARIIAPTFAIRNQSVNYVPQKNHRTPPRTPTRRNDRVIPAPETINQKFRYSEDNNRLPGRPPIRLCAGAGRDNSFEDELQHEAQQCHVEMTKKGLDKSRNWISTRASDSDKNGPHGDINDQWPCEIVDTDHEVIFVENHVYVAPSSGRQKDHYTCYDLQTLSDSLPPYSQSTPKTRKRVLFEKVDYAKYMERRGNIHEAGHHGSEQISAHQSPDFANRLQYRNGGGFENDHDHGCGMSECATHSHRFSNGEIDRDEYGHKWCQDLLNWSREAAEYQRRYNQQMSPPTPLGESCSNNNWFQEKFSHSSGSRYNRMTSGTEDSGVVCQFDDDDVEDDDFWDRPRNSSDANVSTEATSLPPPGQSHVPTGVVNDGRSVAVGEEGDSWEALKRQVFEPPESKITPSRIVRDSEGRLLGRRCSCNSMCTSLCTLETWVDDETFDNNFNEELERRVTADGYGISRN